MAAVATVSEREADAPSGPSKGRGVTLASLCTMVAAVTGLVIGLRQLGDNSYFTHLATGRLILEQGRIPTSDLFSFTANGQPWVVQSWLASLLFGLADRTPGHYGLVLLHAGVTTALALTVWRLTSRARTLVPRVALLALSIAVGAGTWSERPLTFGLLFLAVALLLADGEGRVWLAAPVFWLWVNMHGSFPLGLVALGLIVIGTRLDRTTTDADDWRRPLAVLKWATLGVLAGVVNPLGPTLLLFPLDLLSKQEVLKDVVEWAPPRFTSWSERAFLVLLVVAILGLVRRPRWSSALPLVVFTVAALLAARNVPVAALIILPGAARSLAGLGTLTGEERRPLHRPAAALLLIVAGMLVLASFTRPAFALRSYPVQTMATLRADDPSVRIAAPESAGNYLELAYGTDANVFYDDRFDMYPEQVSRDYVTLVRAGNEWAEVLDRHGIDVVVWPADGALVTVLRASSSWSVQRAQDPNWVIAIPIGSSA